MRRPSWVVAAAVVLMVGTTACEASNGASSDELPVGIGRRGRPPVRRPSGGRRVRRDAGRHRRPRATGGGSSSAEYEGDAIVSATPIDDDPAAGDARSLVWKLSKAGKAGEIAVETEQLEGSLAYIVFNTTGDGRHVWMVAWGSVDAPYVFGLKAASPEDRAALARAFVDAAS